MDYTLVGYFAGQSPASQPPIGQPFVMVVPPWHVVTTKLQKLLARPPSIK
jgi:hypothetical protein